MSSFVIIDPLYGQIHHAADDTLLEELYRAWPLVRLRDISLSSVPSRLSQTGHAPSRFEHSAGVAHLAEHLVRRRPNFAPFVKELKVSGLIHDTGSVPFSHTTEIFQYDQTGRTHEQAVVDVLESPEIKKILKKHGVDAEGVQMLIEGKHPQLQGIIAGTIDLDNLDNSARLIRAMGWVKEPPYQPKEVLEAFSLRNGQLQLNSEYMVGILNWMKCREQLYGDVLYRDNKLAAACMLYRALEFAYGAGALNAKFFAMGESEALIYLMSDAVPVQSRNLIEQCLRWNFFDLGWELVRSGENNKIKRLAGDWEARREFANRIAQRLKIKPELLAVHAGRDKGIKQIDLPFFGRYAEECQSLFSQREMRQRLSVFLHHSVRADRARVGEIAMEVLEEIKGMDDGHSFF